MLAKTKGMMDALPNVAASSTEEVKADDKPKKESLKEKIARQQAEEAAAEAAAKDAE